MKMVPLLYDWSKWKCDLCGFVPLGATQEVAHGQVVLHIALHGLSKENKC